MYRKPGMYRSNTRMFGKLFILLVFAAILWFLLYLAYADFNVIGNYYKHLGM